MIGWFRLISWFRLWFWNVWGLDSWYILGLCKIYKSAHVRMVVNLLHICLTFCLLGNFACFFCLFFCRLLIFFKKRFFFKFFLEYHQGVKQFGSRSGPTFCHSVGPDLCPNCLKGFQQTPLVNKIWHTFSLAGHDSKHQIVTMFTKSACYGIKIYSLMIKILIIFKDYLP